MLLEVTLTSWADRFYLAGISVATVFVILIVLVFVLQIFNMVAQGASKAPKAAAAAAAPAAAQKAAPVADASEEEKAAVATALYLYMNNAHDEESGVLTIAPSQSAWGAVLNPRL